MARQRDPNKKVPVTVRLRPAMLERVKQAAQEDDTTVTEMVTVALDQMFTASGDRAA